MKKQWGIFVLAVCMWVAGCKQNKQKQDAAFWYDQSLRELRAEQGEVPCRKALCSLEQALALDATNSDYWSLKGSLLLLLGMPQMSTESFEKSLSLAKTPSKRAEIINNYACALAESGYEEKAFSMWADVLSEPSYTTPELVYCNQGQYWLRQSKTDKALPLFQKAIKIAEDYSDAYFYLALTAYQEKKYSYAFSVLMNLLAFDEDYEPAKELKKMIEPLLKNIA